MTKATRAGLIVASGAMVAWMAMAGPLVRPGAEGDQIETAAQGVPHDWFRLSNLQPDLKGCLPEGPVRQVEAYQSGRGIGFHWLRYDGADGTAGGGDVWAIPSRSGVPVLEGANLQRVIAKRFPDIRAGSWPDLRGFWATTHDPSGRLLVWLGSRYYDGSTWSRDLDESSDGTTTTFEDLVVSDARDAAWVPFHVTYECPAPARGCERFGVAELRYDRSTGVTVVDPPLSPTVAAGTARYGIPDVMLVPRLDAGTAFVVGQDQVFLLPSRQAVPRPLVDLKAGIAGYATAATRDEKGRLVIAMWTEDRSDQSMSHKITIHALDGTEWAREVLDITDSKLFDGKVAYDRLTSMAFAPDGVTVWLATYGGAVAKVDISQFLQPGFAEVFRRVDLGLVKDERILDLSVDAADVVVIGTTHGVIASRECNASPLSTPTDTPGSVMPPTDPPRETATPSPTVEVRVSATPTELPTSIVPVTATATPTERATTPPRPIYLPQMQNQSRSDAGPVGLDVVWLVDRSATMLAPFGGSRQSALASVAAVLRSHARSLGADEQSALVAFDDTTHVLTPLVAGAGPFGLAIGQLAPADATEGSRLDRGLIVARRELAGPTRRQSARGAVVVISDGTSTGEPTADEVAKAASGLMGDDVAVWAIGLGTDVDAKWLAAAAGESHVLRAADAVALDAAVARVIRSLRTGR